MSWPRRVPRGAHGLNLSRDLIVPCNLLARLRLSAASSGPDAFLSAGSLGKVSRLKSLLYASVSALAAGEEDHEIKRIVAVSRRRNAEREVTGALISNRGRFAQILEGPADAVDEIMASIFRDQRHQQVTVIEVVQARRRRFPGWSLCYSGASHYIDRHIRPLLEGGGREDARQLRQLMQALAED
jgi:hypothetical protein